MGTVICDLQQYSRSVDLPFIPLEGDGLAIIAHAVLRDQKTAERYWEDSKELLNVVASGIVKAVERRKDIVYLPWFWCWIMMIIRNIPEKIFKKLKI